MGADMSERFERTARSLNALGTPVMADLYDEFGGELTALTDARKVMDTLDAPDRLALERAMRVCSRLGGDMDVDDLGRMLALGRAALRRAAALDPAV